MITSDMKRMRFLWCGVVVVCVLAAPVAWSAAPEGAEGTPGDQVMLFPIVKDGKWGYMDKAGKVVIEPQYDGAGDFSEGLAWVGTELLRGYIDKTGKMVIEPKFGWAGSFHSGMAAVFGHRDGKPIGARHGDIWGDEVQMNKPQGGTGYIDRTGTRVKVETRYAGLDFSEGKLCVRGDCLDSSGKKLEHDAADLGPFSDGLAAAKKDVRWGYIDHDMKWVIEPQFTLARAFSEGLAPVVAGDAPAPRTARDYASLRKKGGVKWGFADTSGKVVINCQFEDAGTFSESLAPIKTDGTWGYCDTSGNVAIEAKYDYAWPFSEGRGRVLVGEKHGFVDKTGTLVVEAKYDVAWEFAKGLARVGTGEKEGYIDHDGSYVREPTE